MASGGQPGSKAREKSGENQKEVKCAKQNVQCNKSNRASRVFHRYQGKLQAAMLTLQFENVELVLVASNSGFVLTLRQHPSIYAFHISTMQLKQYH